MQALCTVPRQVGNDRSGFETRSKPTAPAQDAEPAEASETAEDSDAVAVQENPASDDTTDDS